MSSSLIFTTVHALFNIHKLYTLRRYNHIRRYNASLVENKLSLPYAYTLRCYCMYLRVKQHDFTIQYYRSSPCWLWWLFVPMLSWPVVSTERQSLCQRAVLAMAPPPGSPTKECFKCIRISLSWLVSYLHTLSSSTKRCFKCISISLSWLASYLHTLSSSTKGWSTCTYCLSCFRHRFPINLAHQQSDALSVQQRAWPSLFLVLTLTVFSLSVLCFNYVYVPYLWKHEGCAN